MSELAPVQYPSFGFRQPEPEDLMFQSEDTEIRGPVELVPNADFVFPPREPSASTSSPGLQHWQALNQRPRSSQHSSTSSASMASSRRQRPSATALPAFTFNPSTSSSAFPSTTSLDTPPRSPVPTTPTSPTSPRAIGHRRGGSEFIGGDVRAGGSGVMSTSPTKGIGALPSPSPNSLGPPPPLPSPNTLGPPGRARHGHRRSQALSGHDIASIIGPREPATQPIGGSAPVTPMDTEDRPFFSNPSRSRRALSETASRPSIEQSEDIGQPNEVSPPRHPMPRRVAFRESPEYFNPRPLSTISSETESSSISVVRGHSARNSINSILSGSASPSSRKKDTTLSPTSNNSTPTQRPQSAGNILDVHSRSKEGFHLPYFGSRPKSAHGPESDQSEPRTPGKRMHFLWGNKEKGEKHQQARATSIPTSSSEPSLAVSPAASDESSPGVQKSLPELDALAHGSPVRNVRPTHKEHKAKNWPRWRKNKPEQKEKTSDGDVATTELPFTPAQDEAGDVIDIETVANFDDDNTVTIVDAPEEATNYWTDTPRSTAEDRDTESPRPLIDLDAALGPYGTPQLSSNLRGRRNPPTLRPMRSLNTNYNSHRRAESAPALEPFLLQAPKKKPSFMEDVFEENEDEGAEGKFDAAEGKSVDAEDYGLGAPNADTSAMKHNRVNVDSATTDAPIPAGTTAIASLDPPATPAVDETATPVTGISPVEVVESYEEPRASTLEQQSDSTITPSVTPDPKEPDALLPMSVHASPLRPITAPGLHSGSTFPAPDVGHTHGFEGTRLGTASSSMTDHRQFLEPGQRASVDDVPSLTSSISTTSPRYGFHRPASAVTHDAPRSSSVFSGNEFFERTRHRASIAGMTGFLARNRSRLNIESRPQSQHIDSSTSALKRDKKEKRMSWLSRIWKPKKKTAEPGPATA